MTITEIRWMTTPPTPEQFLEHAKTHTSKRFPDGRVCALWLLRPKPPPKGWDAMARPNDRVQGPCQQEFWVHTRLSSKLLKARATRESWSSISTTAASLTIPSTCTPTIGVQSPAGVTSRLSHEPRLTR
jgi:hypothetical protein